jgi:phosphopantetheinyl transferase (holo-ACP synthase)
MIGNDVVDLELAKIQSNWKRKGFLDKIFTLKEQEFIINHSNSERLVWELWSRKEAVYKIIIQKGEKPGYYPKRIECLKNGIVIFENQLFYTKTFISNNLIHTIAVENKSDFNKINEIVKPNFIKKVDGIPFYQYKAKLYSASKSHHGKFEKMVWLQS